LSSIFKTAVGVTFLEHSVENSQ